jgi:integrase
VAEHQADLPELHAFRNSTKSSSILRTFHRDTGQTRHVPLNSEIVDVLETWRRSAAEPERFVFSGNDTTTPLTAARKAWKAVLRTAKIDIRARRQILAVDAHRADGALLDRTIFDGDSADNLKQGLPDVLLDD